MRSITEVLFPLGDAAIVHPGHGPDTTIGRERATNPFVLEYFAAKVTQTASHETRRTRRSLRDFPRAESRRFPVLDQPAKRA